MTELIKMPLGGWLRWAEGTIIWWGRDPRMGRGNFGAVWPIGKHLESLLWCMQRKG